MPSPHERALQSDIPPKTKSDSKWLHDMGYRGGLREFGISFGFKLDEMEDARELVAQFRDEQQEEWEKLHPDKQAKQDNASQSKSDTTDTTTTGNARAKKQELVKLAMLWHLRMGHGDYHTLLKLPEVARGVPSFEGLEVQDLPACEACTSAGADPFKRPS